MLGELISRILLMIFGYAYPAFQCYKVVEKTTVDNQELRFWCQYWILVAILSVLERIGDIFVSWLPMYGELKLALFIYLWYPNTKGSDYVYDVILRPYVTKHEIDIDQKLLDWRARAWDLALFYWKNCTDLGQSAFFQVVHYLASQSSRFGQANASENEDDHQHRAGNNKSSSSTANRAVSAGPTKSKVVQAEASSETTKTEYVHIEGPSILEELFAPKQGSSGNPEANGNNNLSQRLNQRFRRFK